MNPDEENERPMPSDQEFTAHSDASRPQDDPRPGTTDVQAYIGRQLRAVYDDVVNQPIPDRFLALMKRLEDQTPKG